MRGNELLEKIFDLMAESIEEGYSNLICTSLSEKDESYLYVAEKFEKYLEKYDMDYMYEKEINIDRKTVYFRDRDQPGIGFEICWSPFSVETSADDCTILINRSIAYDAQKEDLENEPW